MVGFKQDVASTENMLFVKPASTVNGQGPPKIKRKKKEEQKGASAIQSVAAKINPWANLGQENTGASNLINEDELMKNSE